MEAALQGKPEIEPLSTCSSSGYRRSSGIGADGSNTSLNTSGTIETSTGKMSSTVEIVTSPKETKKRKTEANEKVHVRSSEMIRCTLILIYCTIIYCIFINKRR